jgi:hypothetical protein
MNRLRTKRGRRTAAGVAAGLLVGLPLSAFLAAPSAHADNSPGANLAGLNANAYSTALQFIPLVKGLVPAGNLSTGNFFQVSVPYASSSSETGPASNAIASPVYPGPVATGLPGALQTFGFPASFAALTAYPVITEASYPPAPGRGSSGTYTPPAGSTSGAGESKTSATESGASSQSNSNSSSFDNGQITLGSSHTDTATVIKASSVADQARAEISHVSILNGLVEIASVTSSAAATSDGNNGTQTSDLHVGNVTVAGQPAYIGPDGLHLAGNSNNVGVTQIFNSALTALQQAGISVTTINPNSTENGAVASVDSGAVQIEFTDPNIPNVGGQVPVNSVGTDVDLGLTHADAQATVYPPLPPITPITGSGAVTPISSGPAGSTSGPAPSSFGGSPAVSTNSGVSTPSAQSPSYAPTQSQTAVSAQPASFVGMPTRMAWVVMSILISIVASGPLLGYANWQLLRGRKA